jgi:predicted ribosomally synthesized peptide with nif11-like leader
LENKLQEGKTMAGITEFKEKVAADEAFAAKFKDVKSAEELVEIAAKEGFTFTVDDITESTELSDDDLEAAAGGRTILAKNRFVSNSTIFGEVTFVAQ